MSAARGGIFILPKSLEAEVKPLAHHKEPLPVVVLLYRLLGEKSGRDAICGMSSHILFGHQVIRILLGMATSNLTSRPGTAEVEG